MSDFGKDVGWFRHDMNARHDKGIVLLRASEWGDAGVGKFWFIVEMLREETNYKLPNTDETIAFVAHELRLDDADTRRFLDFIVSRGLLERDADWLWSDRLNHDMAALERYRERRRAAAEKASHTRHYGNNGNGAAAVRDVPIEPSRPHPPLVRSRGRSAPQAIGTLVKKGQEAK